MSLRAFVAVNRCPHVKGAARRAAFQLADAHNDARGDAFPGQRLMAAREGVSTKTIENGVRQLEEAGFVVVERRRGRGNRYRLLLDRMEALAIDRLPDGQAPNPAYAPQPSSVANNPDRSTEAMFRRGQKPASAKSSTNRIEPGKAQVPNPEDQHNGRSRLQWARDIAYYRRKLDDGVPRPIWPFYAGPRPGTSGCFAPLDLLHRHGFGDVTAKRGP